MAGDETILLTTKPFPAFGADIRKQRKGINLPTKRRAAPAAETETT